MGLLDSTFADPNSAGLLGIASGLLAAGGPSTQRVNLGQAISAGLLSGQTAYQGAKNNQMMEDYKNQQLALMQLDEKRKQAAFDMQQSALKYFIGAGAGSPQADAIQPSIGQLGSGTFGTFPTASGVPSIPPMSAQNASAAPNSRNESDQIKKITALTLAGVPGAKELFDIYKYANEPQQFQAGNTYRDRNTGQERYIPKLGEGAQVGADGIYRNLPGYADSIAQSEGAKAGAIEAAKAPYVDKTVVLPSGPRMMSGAQLRDYMAGNSGIPTFNQQPSGTPVGGVNPGLINALIDTESGGNPNAVSPKGASGLFQVMPKTALNPGLGVAPAKDNSPEEIARVGRDYFGALHSKYQDPTIAAIAYNWGPGNTDLWLKSGGDFNKLPAETKNYVSSVMTKAAVNNRGGGMSASAGGQGDNLPGIALQSDADKAVEMKQVNQKYDPSIESAKKIAEGQAGNFTKYQDTLNTRVQEGFNLARRNNELLSQINQFQTGSMGSDARIALASQVQNMFPGNDAAKNVATKIAGGDVAAGQELQSLFAGAALSNLKQVLDGQGRINNTEFKAFQGHSESLATDPDALRKIVSLQTKIYNQDLQEQQGLSDALKSGKVNPATWQADWAKVQNDKYLPATMQLNASQSGPASQSAPITAVAKPPLGAINMLKLQPSLRAAFDQKYGAGAAASVLGK